MRTIPLIVFVLLVVADRFDGQSPVAKPHGKDHSSSLHSLPGAGPVVMPESYLLAAKNSQDATAVNVSRDPREQ